MRLGTMAGLHRYRHAVSGRDLLGNRLTTKKFIIGMYGECEDAHYL